MKMHIIKSVNIRKLLFLVYNWISRWKLTSLVFIKYQLRSRREGVSPKFIPLSEGCGGGRVWDKKSVSWYFDNLSRQDLNSFESYLFSLFSQSFFPGDWQFFVESIWNNQVTITKWLSPFRYVTKTLLKS